MSEIIEQIYKMQLGENPLKWELDKLYVNNQ